ncbi:hypothetical protein B0G75_112194 [Paraburkholderia sp. BL18I3N2]|nr:hypothetical protein B0G75_112194 [Paraburkholderia sp. BL18I3N2]
MKESLRGAGLGGVDPHDDARALRAWRWMQWVLFAFSVLAIPHGQGRLDGGALGSARFISTTYRTRSDP